METIVPPELRWMGSFDMSTVVNITIIMQHSALYTEHLQLLTIITTS